MRDLAVEDRREATSDGIDTVQLPATILASALTFSIALGANADEPATVESARAVLDLSRFPVPDGAEAPTRRRPAALAYEAPGTVADAFAHVQKRLKDGGWEEQPGGYASEQAASGVYEKEGFRVSVTVFAGSKPGKTSVAIQNHGNLSDESTPKPDGAEPFFTTPVGTSYLVPGDAASVADQVRGRLLQLGWEPYGEAGDVRYYKRNAVRLGVRSVAAPAQGGKTMVAYSAELMSADLPAPPEASRVQYADATTELSFDAKRDPAELFAFYRGRLGDAGWKPTAATPTRDRGGDSLMFLNDAKDLLTLEIRPVDGLSRGRLRHRSAAEVAAALEANSRPQARPEAPAPGLVATVRLPDGSRGVEASPKRIAFKQAAGRGRPAAQEIAGRLKAAGWRENVAALEGPAGAVSLAKEKASLLISYTDVGLGDAELTIDAVGVELKREP